MTLACGKAKTTRRAGRTGRFRVPDAAACERAAARSDRGVIVVIVVSGMRSSRVRIMVSSWSGSEIRSTMRKSLKWRKFIA